MAAIKKRLFSEFESPLPHMTINELGGTSARTVPRKYVHYRPAKLVRGKRWYVSFSYRKPDGSWERFRVFDTVNRFRDLDYCLDYVDTINKALARGFNPFDEKETFDPPEMTVEEAMNFFNEKQKERGLQPSTLSRYRYITELIVNWCDENNILSAPVKSIRKTHIEKILSGSKTLNGWSNRQYNNVKGYVSIVFSFLVKQEVISLNPATSVERLKSKSTKHKYYDTTLFKKVTEVLKENDPYLWAAAQFVYYLGVRSSKELRLMKCGDIIEDGLYFRFRGEATKSNRDDIIPIDPNLRKVIIEMNLLDFNPRHYIFGIKKKPSEKPVNADYFSSRFAAIRKLAGLDSSYTLYGMKHTRCTHLIKDGAKLSDISRLMRHRDVATTAKYIRDLGVDFDSTEIEKLTRKI